jgi:hypothetical protein
MEENESVKNLKYWENFSFMQLLPDRRMLAISQCSLHNLIFLAHWEGNPSRSRPRSRAQTLLSPYQSVVDLLSELLAFCCLVRSHSSPDLRWTSAFENRLLVKILIVSVFCHLPCSSSASSRCSIEEGCVCLGIHRKPTNDFLSVFVTENFDLDRNPSEQSTINERAKRLEMKMFIMLFRMIGLIWSNMTSYRDRRSRDVATTEAVGPKTPNTKGSYDCFTKLRPRRTRVLQYSSPVASSGRRVPLQDSFSYLLYPPTWYSLTYR